MKVATVRGIGVYIHWTFWVLMVAYLFPVLTQSGWQAALAAGAFIAGVFASVVAHEFGHAAAAGYYGIRTADITLLPIGGVARLTRLPDKPIQELVIALAGPAVNVGIVALLFPLILAGVAWGDRAPALGLEMDLLFQLVVANVILFAFNLLPAFPMDGGRVLRALLAMRTTHLRATQIAAKVGRWMALLFAILAIYPGPITLLLVAAFVFIAGTAELMSVHVREMAKSTGQGTTPDPNGTSPFGQSPFGPGHSSTFQGSWTTKVWPNQQPYETDADIFDGEIIDAVEVKKIEHDR